MEEVYFANIRGEKLAGVFHEAKNEGKKNSRGIILVHGFLDTKERMKLWADFLSSDFNVLRFDLSGHGESEGKLEDMTLARLLQDMDAAIAFMKNRNISSIGMAGHSLGGALSLLSIGRAKAVCSVAGPTDFTKRSLNKYGLKSFDQSSGKHSIYDSVKSAKVPVLFVHGDNDTVVPFWHSEDGLKSALEGSRLETMQGMGHNFWEEPYHERIIEITKQWFAGRL